MSPGNTAVRFWIKDEDGTTTHPVTHDEYIHWLEDQLCVALWTSSVAQEALPEGLEMQASMRSLALTLDHSLDIRTSSFKLTLWNSFLTRHSSPSSTPTT